MRLTLRTLLAYLDDILDPEDSREIAQKIEESEFASSLMHRTRDVIRRLRLAAPSLGERGQGFDPNTVAEYLDNTLPADRVPDFEKVCLESDVQLAEVASCHQILTMVLGEPAEVEPASRGRMYDLPDLLTAKAVEPSQPATSTPVKVLPEAGVPAEEAKQARAKPMVPDYLREPAPRTRRLLPSLGAVFLLGVLVVLLLAAARQFEPGSPWMTFLGISVRTAETSAPSEATPPVVAKAEPPTAKPEATKPEPAPKESPAKPTATPEPARTPADTTVSSSDTKNVASVPVAPMPAEAKPATLPTAGPPLATKADLKLAPPTPAPMAEKPVPTKPDMVAKTEPGRPAPGVEPTAKATSMVPPANPSGVNPLRQPEPTTADPLKVAKVDVPKTLPLAAPGEAAPMPPERLGRFLLDRQVLLQFDRASGSWMRMGPQAALNSSQPILSLPSYQPILALTVGVTVQLVGGTQLELMPTDSQGTPGLKIGFGRAVARAVGEAKARLRLQVGDRVGTIAFKNAESTLGISMDRVRTPGSNPEEEPGAQAASLYAVSGDFVWEEGDGKSAIPLAAPALLRIGTDPQPVPTPMKELPKWLSGDEASWLDHRASAVLEQEIKVNRPVSLSLRELTNHRREEVAWLAARSLGYLDEFDSMVASLNAPDQRAVWEDYMRSLQQAVSRGRESAAKVRAAFEQRYPSHAPRLFRMLWGYTPEELQSGQGATLVGYLDHELLIYRVMAYHNLEKLTGLKFNYQPQATTLKRQTAVSRWKERLQTGLFARPKEKPTKPEKPSL